ncbi:PREDICTED: uncharacterized protein LOC102030196 [Chinchilla lanigera]|uniref:uncharacterized protein LOC102030196 n=1 Tax=Chinchilla lanigera TaxID=34839 RepID=UPI000697EA48|nr:PREDICTED: uncharacterized protein LOC102030196 [Chinchilla lanigera]
MPLNIRSHAEVPAHVVLAGHRVWWAGCLSQVCMCVCSWGTGLQYIAFLLVRKKVFRLDAHLHSSPNIIIWCGHGGCHTVVRLPERGQNNYIVSSLLTQCPGRVLSYHFLREQVERGVFNLKTLNWALTVECLESFEAERLCLLPGSELLWLPRPGEQHMAETSARHLPQLLPPTHIATQLPVSAKPVLSLPAGPRQEACLLCNQVPTLSPEGSLRRTYATSSLPDLKILVKRKDDVRD